MVGISKKFGNNEVLHELSFQAHDGRITGFVGANGAGKTTALKILAGLIQPDRGSTRIGSLSNEGHTDSSIGFFLGADMLPLRMTGTGYISYICTLKEIEKSEGIRWLNHFSLDTAAKHRISQYSLGMRQRLALASAFLGEPKNIVLDEPLNGLDIEGVKLVRDLLCDFSKKGHCILLSSHLLSELELVANDIVLIAEGDIVSSGTLNTLRKVNHNVCEIVTSQQEQLVNILSSENTNFHVDKGTVKVEGLSIKDLMGILITNDIDVLSISKSQRSIEQLYLDKVKGNNYDR